MKVSGKQLLFFYAVTIFLLTIYTLTSIKECEAYWMHDASITITKKKVLINTSYLFLLPVLIILVQTFLKINTQTKLFLTHFFIALTSISLLLLTIDKPCKNLNGGHYMFVSSTMILGYYLFKVTSFIIIGIIIIQTIKLTKNKKSTVVDQT